MPAIRRTPSSTSVDGNQLGKDGKNVGNDQGSSSTTGALNRTGSSSKQSTLSFTSKKALPPTPDKKRKSGDAPDTATAPLSPPATPSFARKAKAVESDVIKSGSSAANASPSVPSGYKPLGDDENDAMVANLKGVDMLQDDGSESDADEAEQSSPLHPHRSSGVRARKAMLRATDEINKARTATPAPVAKGGKGKGKVPASMEFGAKLDPKDKKWQAIYAKTSEAMGGDDCPPVHCTPKSHTRVHHILRVFDLTPDYGPCVGVTRLQRWERAQEWGLEPPQEVRDILLTHEGAEDDSYRETVFHNTGIYVPTA